MNYYSYAQEHDRVDELASFRTLIAQDGLHFSGKMYGKWVDLVMEVVLNE